MRMCWRTSAKGAGAILAIAMIFFLLVAPAQATTGTVYSPEELAFVVELNHYRAMNGVKTLMLSDSLSEVSRRHSCDMARYDFLSHYTMTHESQWFPYKSDPWDRMDLSGYSSYYGAGEIIGAGQATADSLFDGFEASSHHVKIMLHAGFSAVGISLEETKGADCPYYWTVDFGGYADGSTSGFSLYEEDDSALTFKGEWVEAVESSSSGGSHYELDSEGSLAVGFMGTSLSWVAEKSRDSGIAKLTLDEGAPVYVDLYDSRSEHQRCVYSTGTLPEGRHTVFIEWTGDHNPRASGSLVTVDAFDVQGSLSSLGTELLLADLCDLFQHLYRGLKGG